MNLRLSRVQDHFSRARMIDALLDTGEYGSRKDAGHAVDAVSSVIRAWLIAWTENCPQNIEPIIQLPGALSFHLGWIQYPNGPFPVFRMSVRLTARAANAYRRVNNAVRAGRTFPYPARKSN
jgi:hypothetical protein